MTDYEAVIGLETHIQLNTQSKIFCACKADSWGDPANTNICPVCSGLPGVLPVLNEKVVEKAVLLGTAMNSDVAAESYFDRKNYFYPDLPKGYQITQHEKPIGVGGYMDFPVPAKGDKPAYTCRVTIHDLHLEEDAGKTKNVGNEKLVDLNRSGVALIEMVTGPDLRSADEAAQYLTRLRQLLRWLGVSDADMEKGHLRADANVSVRPRGATYLNPKTEIKNVNSIDAIHSAIETEISRQISEMEAGRKITSWTLDWDADTGKLSKMRSKETEADYRYFREPDLLPVVISDEERAEMLKDFPELPLARLARFQTEYQLPEYDAEILTGEKALSDYFEQAVKAYAADPKRVSNWMMNEVLRLLNERGLSVKDLKLSPAYLADIIRLVDDGKINNATGKSLLAKVQDSGVAPNEIVQKEGLAQVSDEGAIQAAVQKVVASAEKECESYRAGKTGLMGWFVGQVMKEMHGKADPQTVRKLLEEKLG